MDLFLMKAKDGHAYRAAALDAPTLLIGNVGGLDALAPAAPRRRDSSGVGVRQCGGEVRQAGERGAFASGRGARRYCGWQQCAWHLVAPDDDIVVLWLPSFQLECMEGPSGPFDAVRVYDGASLLSPSLGVFSCRTAATVASTGSHVLVQVRALGRRSPRFARPAPRRLPRPTLHVSPRLPRSSRPTATSTTGLLRRGVGRRDCGAAPSCPGARRSRPTCGAARRARAPRTGGAPCARRTPRWATATTSSAARRAGRARTAATARTATTAPSARRVTAGPPARASTASAATAPAWCAPTPSARAG